MHAIQIIKKSGNKKKIQGIDHIEFHLLNILRRKVRRKRYTIKIKNIEGVDVNAKKVDIII